MNFTTPLALSRFGFGATFTSLALALPLLWTQPASAQQVCGERTCPKGFTCESAPAPCPDIGCDGADCPTCEGEVQFCAPASCTSDSECGEGMLCAEFTHQCDGGVEPACPRDADCPAPPEVQDCETKTTQLCAARWQLPCNTSSDCGEGFTCEERESCSTEGSSGSGAMPSDFGGEDAAPREGNEPAATTCTPTGTFACVPIVTACTSDAQCAAGWTCRDNPEGVCWSGPDGEGCSVADPAKLCLPPHSDIAADGGFGLGEAATGSPDSAAPPRGSAKGESGSASPSANGGGCTLSSTPSPASGLGWLALGFAAALASRRRSGSLLR